MSGRARLTEESLSENLSRHARYHRAIDRVAASEAALMEALSPVYGELTVPVLHRVRELLGSGDGFARSFCDYSWCPDVVLLCLAEELGGRRGPHSAVVNRLRRAARGLSVARHQARQGSGGLDEATARMECLADAIAGIAATLP